MAWVATAIGVGAVATAGAGVYAANKQSEAAGNAAKIAEEQYGQTRADLSLYRAIGQDAGNRLGAQLTDLTSPIVMNEATLEKTPGYQFTRTQGLKAVQNSAALRGLGSSGAALKGAANFATGLADNTYQNQFNNAQTNQANAFNRLKALVDTGENASAQTGASGTAAAGTAASATAAAGNAQAAGANAVGGSISNAANNFAGYQLYRGLYGGGQSGGGAPGGSSTAVTSA